MRRFEHKKALGQHFLKSTDTAERIVALLGDVQHKKVLEIGPGLGILTRHLKQTGADLYCSELDERIIELLRSDLHIASDHIITGDFLKADLHVFAADDLHIIGNFPYHISSQILFTVLDHKEGIPVVVGMFQQEMAERVCAVHGNKEYGVITVLVQAYYDTELVFTLPPDAFDPPPAVHSAVIRLIRKKEVPSCSMRMLRTVVKSAFNQRRKQLHNALKPVAGAGEILSAMGWSDKRPEQLSVENFIYLATALEEKK